MESATLSSASKYLNNLLLARGLLKNGKSIDFAHPADASGETDTNMSAIINVVHDLVLRRDRDAEQRENLATTIRILRAEEGQRVLDMQRVQDKNAELARDLNVAETQERALRVSVRRAEAQARDLREQTLKMKSTVDQVRAKCLSDVRKKDLEIEKLKAIITGKDNRRQAVSGRLKTSNSAQTPAHGSKDKSGSQDSNGDEWSLEKESSEFLAALVNETSTENVALRGIVEKTIQTLRDMMGSDAGETDESREIKIVEKEAIGIPGQYRRPRVPSEEKAEEAALVSCEILARNMEIILEHCQSILKDPSFVPIEEVQVREDEIMKLRAGWEKMAGRWKETVKMMDSWRRRMLEDGGKSINVDDFSALSFGRSVAVLPNGEPVLGRQNEELSVLFDTSKMDQHGYDGYDGYGEGLNEHLLDQTGLLHHMLEESEEQESELDIPPEPSPKRLAASPAKRGIRLPRPVGPLQESSGNTRTASFGEGSTSSLGLSGDSGIGSLDGSLDDENDTFAARPRSKIPRKTLISAMTMEEKLLAIEAEAQLAAEHRQKQDAHKRKPPKTVGPRKRNERRSTLNPDELAQLMGAR